MLTLLFVLQVMIFYWINHFELEFEFVAYRKSGIPLAVLIPAPAITTTLVIRPDCNDSIIGDRAVSITWPLKIFFKKIVSRSSIIGKFSLTKWIFGASFIDVRLQPNFAHAMIPQRCVLWRKHVYGSHWLPSIIATSYEQISFNDNWTVFSTLRWG